MSATEPIEKDEQEGGPCQLSGDVREAKPEAARPGRFIGGEVRIIADSLTGAMNVIAPENLLVALGIIESAKAMLIKRQQDAIEKANKPAIIAPTAADLGMLRKPS